MGRFTGNCAKGDIEAVRKRIRDKGLASAKAKVDEFGRNGLHMAATIGRREVASYLIEKGWDPSATTHTGHTPLHLAATRARYEIVKIILSSEVGRSTISTVDDEGKTPIISSCVELHDDELGRNETIKLLVENSADINAQDRAGKTALHFACGHGYLSAIRLLLDLGANPLIKDFGGLQPKNAYHGDEGVRYILEKKIEELQLKQQ